MSEQITTVVSGLSRSGTSLMMRILAIGGMIPVVSDGGNEHADADNPHGYYESQALWQELGRGEMYALNSARGKAVKILARLTPSLPIDDRQYKVIWMQREASEVKASRDGSFGTIPPKPWVKHSTGPVSVQLLEELRVRALSHWTALRAEILCVRFHDLIDSPERELRRVIEFVPEFRGSLFGASRLIDPSLRHHQYAKPQRAPC